MPSDIFFPWLFFQTHHLSLFQVVIVNSKHPCTIGLSSSEKIEISDKFFARSNIVSTDVLKIQLPLNIFPIKCCKIKLL